MALTLSGDDGVAGVNGSATTPAIQGTDTNTGLTFGTDTVNVVTGGSTRTTVDSSGRLLVGTSTAFSSVRNAYESEATPTRQTYVATAINSVNNGFGIYNFSSSGYAPNLDLCASKNNTVGSHTIVSSDQALGHINFGGSDGTQFRVGATILAAADGTPGASDMPGKLVFSTTADGDSFPTEAVRIDSSQNLRFNSGYGSVATAYGVRAWINFDGTAATIGTGRGSGNMDAVTDGGNGVYTVNFTNDMPDNNYAVLTGTHDYTTFGVHDTDSPTAGSVKFQSRNPGNASALERYYYAVAIVR